jgi:O-antigen ligase/tetratricopeptide (TPR) repeat protein
MATKTPFSELRRTNTDESGSERFSRWLLNVVDMALAGCIFLVPLLLGGRSALGHFGLTICATIAASAWWLRQGLLPRQYWRRSGAHLILLAAIGLVALQLAPLPPSWTSQLSPKTSAMLSLWGEGGPAGFGAWQQLSLAPAEGRNSFVLLLAYALVFWVTVQRIRSMEDAERLLRWTAYSAVGMGLFGLLQYFTDNGKFFWVYQHPFATTEDAAKGAFTNRNHFAHFLALGLGPVIWWVQEGMRRHDMRNDGFVRIKSARNRAATLDMSMRIAGLLVVFFAILASMSRGGAIAAGLAAAVSVVVCYRGGVLRGKFALGLTAVAILLGAFLLVGAQDSMAGRIDQLASGSLEQIDRAEGRRSIWRTTIAAIPDYGCLGSGAGSFREIYPLYMQVQQGHSMPTHAENGYLQVTLEAGYSGLALIVLAILLGVFWLGRGLLRANSTRIFVAVGAVAAAMLASLVHSGVDFVWYAPGCMVVTLILAACACRISQFTHEEQRRRWDRFVLPRPAAWLAAPAVVALGGWMVATQIGPLTAEPHWTQYQRLQRAAYLNPPTVELPEKSSVFSEDPSAVAADEEEARQQVMAIQLERERGMVTELAEVVRRDPNHAEAQLALAGGYLRLFQFAQDKAINRMPLSQIRDAAVAANYTSREEIEDWLSGAVGEHYHFLLLSLEHAKAALALCPMQGKGYLYLGELCFLDVDHDAGVGDFVEQALRVRPYDGTVLFHAGREAWLAGRAEEGLDFWTKSFAAGPIYQRQVIDWMAGRTLPSAITLEIEFIIAQFHPDLDTLKYMQWRYTPMTEPEQMTPLLKAIVRASRDQAQLDMEEKQPELAAERWLDAMSACMTMERFDEAIDCGKQAVECHPHGFDARYRLGFLLSERRRYAEADEHLSWCARAKPGHTKLRQRLTDVKRLLLDPESADARLFGRIRPRGADFAQARLQVPAPVPMSVPGQTGPMPQSDTAGQQQAGPSPYPTYPQASPPNPPSANQGRFPTSVYHR